MRKRCNRKIRPLINPLQHVADSIRPVTSHKSFLLDLNLKNHSAMAALSQGKANKGDMDTLVACLNVTKALYLMGVGAEYGYVAKGGLEALLAVCQRGAATGRFVMRSSEMAAINEAIELHDAQLETITVKELERAMKIVQDVIKNKRATVILEK